MHEHPERTNTWPRPAGTGRTHARTHGRTRATVLIAWKQWGIAASLLRPTPHLSTYRGSGYGIGA